MKYALHIGINRYDKAVYGNANLQQCVHDAERMYDMSTSMGFSAILMRDESARKSELISMLTDYAKVLEPGDILFFSQSSHGTYWDTTKGRSTGLCMHDAVFWDFEMVPLWKAFKPGVLIIRVIDCCYAESNFRMTQMPGLVPRLVKTLKAPFLTATKNSLRGCKCSIISFSSSSIKEVSYENEFGGVFTSNFIDNLEAGRLVTYRKLRDKTLKSIQQKGYPQTPKLETVNAGDHANGAIFGN